MAREKEGYRDTLELLLKHFGSKTVLTVAEVMEFTGRSRNFVRKYLVNGKDPHISVCDLARRMCQ